EIVGASDWSVNKAGFVVHSAVHGARHDAACVIHLHTVDGVAVSMAEDGLLFWNQNAMMFANEVAMHDFEGVADKLDERERLVADLGERNNLMILRNHGTLALGPSIAEAFTAMFYFEKACQTQTRALSMGLPLRQVSDQVIQGVAAYRQDGRFPVSEPLVWPAMKRMLDRLYPDWRG
ncbi:MAG: class II aldolase/adducin family protein, partial [Novosphingobium sp.]|nr:class II aldolase/adducin family protein [Novosphingobium sp.]